MEIGLGIDGRFALGADEQRAIAREAASLGYQSLWTPIGPTREPFDLCALWHEASGLETGVAVAPLSGWSSDELASVAKDTLERCRGRFTLGVGSGRETAAPIRVMREAAAALRPRLRRRGRRRSSDVVRENGHELRAPDRRRPGQGVPRPLRAHGFWAGAR